MRGTSHKCLPRRRQYHVAPRCVAWAPKTRGGAVDFQVLRGRFVSSLLPKNARFLTLFATLPGGTG